MRLRRYIERAARHPKGWIWLFVGILAAFTVTRALSQPALEPADNPADVAQPLPATDPVDDLVVKAYYPDGANLESALEELRAQHAAVKGFRAAADGRTGKLIVVAPASVHQKLAATMKPADDPSVRPAAAAMAPRAQKSFQLKNTKWRDFETALKGLAGRQLPVAEEQDGRVANYTLTSRSGQHVILNVDRPGGKLTFDGPADLVGGWVRVAMALDAPHESTTERSRVVPIRDATPAARGAIQKALAIVGQKVNETTVDTTGQLVSMRLQPRGEGGQDAAQPGDAGPRTTVLQPGDAAQPGQPPSGDQQPGEDAGGGLLGPVQIEFLEGLDQIVIRGNPRDVERVMKIIQDIEAAAIETAPDVEIKYLQNVDSQAIATLINELYTQVFAARYGNISITPLVKPNAVLLIGRRESIDAAISLIDRLDQRVAPETQFQIFPLRHAAAAEVEATIREYLSGGVTTPGGGGAGGGPQGAGTGVGLSTRGVVIGDYRTNSLIVRASPRDLQEIGVLINRIDVPVSASVNQLRVFTLRNSFAEELAPVLQSAITGQGQQARGQQQGGGGGGGFGAGGGGGGFQQFQQQQQGGQQRGNQQQQQIKSTMLQFLALDAQGKRILRSGILTDVRITADPTGNSLIVSAPEESMELIAALIAELDRVPTSTAQIKVFEIRNGDAQTLMTMLQQLFGLQQTGAAGAGRQQGFFPQLIVPEGEGNPLVTLRFSVDTRTNSLIASGSAGDLAVVEAILLRLDEADVRQRRSIVYRLKNVAAVDVANTLTTLLTSQRQIQQLVGNQFVSPFEQIEREVVVVPEVVTNSLIISATPRFFTEIQTIIEDLDRRPPMVAIQVLIAEVTLTNTDEFGVELGLQDSVLFDRSLLENVQFLNTTTTNPNQTTTQTQQVLSATNTPGFNFNNVVPLGNSGSAAALSRSDVVGPQGLSNFALGRLNNELGFGGLVLSASSESVSFLLRALSESRRLDVLARPQVTTLENQAAYVQVGQSVPLISGVTITPGVGQTNNIQPANVGLILLVQPRVTADNLVVMNVRAERSEVGPEAEGIPISISATGEVIRQPRINQTIAETTVSALNGQTLVLGGLISKSKSETHRRVPLLSDIPVLGHLFRYDNVQGRRTELLIIMTPRVIRNQQDADTLKQVEAARMSWCLADVIKIHGESGLRGRNAEWTDAETTTIYPHFTPEMLEGVVPGAPEEIAPPVPSTAPPASGSVVVPPPPAAMAPPGSAPRLPPPTSAPPVPGPNPSLQLPTPAPAQEPPPTLPAPDSSRAGMPAARHLTQQPGQPVGQPQPQPQPHARGVAMAPAAPNASQNSVMRGSYYATPASSSGPTNGAAGNPAVEQALYQPPAGTARRAIFEFPAGGAADSRRQ